MLLLATRSSMVLLSRAPWLCILADFAGERFQTFMVKDRDDR